MHPEDQLKALFSHFEICLKCVFSVRKRCQKRSWFETFCTLCTHYQRLLSKFFTQKKPLQIYRADNKATTEKKKGLDAKQGNERPILGQCNWFLSIICIDVVNFFAFNCNFACYFIFVKTFPRGNSFLKESMDRIFFAGLFIHCSHD